MPQEETFVPFVLYSDIERYTKQLTVFALAEGYKCGTNEHFYAKSLMNSLVFRLKHLCSCNLLILCLNSHIL